MIIARKNFPEFWGHVPPAPRSPTPMWVSKPRQCWQSLTVSILLFCKQLRGETTNHELTKSSDGSLVRLAGRFLTYTEGDSDIDGISNTSQCIHSISILSVWSLTVCVCKRINRPGFISARQHAERAICYRKSVCLSVTRVDQSKTVERIIEILSPSDRPNILVF